MEEAARRLGVACTYERRSRAGEEAQKRRWLRLDIRGEAFFYRAGTLRRDGGDATVGRNINGFAPEITAHRMHTKEFLAVRSVPVPIGLLFSPSELSKARAFVGALARPVSVKPNGRRSGAETHRWITSLSELGSAFKSVAGHTDDILVEEQVDGDLIRFLFVAPTVVAVQWKRQAVVSGDGTTTVRGLVGAWNRQRLERAVPGHQPHPQDDILRGLGRGRVAPDDVPGEGETIALVTGPRADPIHDAVECAGSIHPSYVPVAEAACRAIPGLVIGAVDMVVADRGRPAAPGNHHVVEAFSTPAIADFHYPWEGESQDVGGAIVDWLSRGGAA